MKDSKKLRQEVKRIGRGFILKKLIEKGFSEYALPQALTRGKMSLELSLAMYDITNLATNFWQAPGIHETDGSMKETKPTTA